MSDIDSDTPMDDAPAPSKNQDILFSSANTDAKGKRSAANLPIEAEDSLPWVSLERILTSFETTADLHFFKFRSRNIVPPRSPTSAATMTYSRPSTSSSTLTAYHTCFSTVHQAQGKRVQSSR